MAKTKDKPEWRSRITSTAEVDPSDLLANPRNWRIHPKKQQLALEMVLDEVGWVDEVIVNETTGFVVDGHLRASLALRRNEKRMPVKYVRLTEAEEALVMATLDPIGSMAAVDEDKLADLLNELNKAKVGADALLAMVADAEGVSYGEDTNPPARDVTIYEQAVQLKPQNEYIVVTCVDAADFDTLKKLLQLRAVKRGGYSNVSTFNSVGTERVIPFQRLMGAIAALVDAAVQTNADSSSQQEPKR